MRTTIEQWRVFGALVEHGSYAAAAGALNKSVSSVHTAIQKLQSSLNVSLVEVEGRRVQLTAAGRQLRRRSASLLEQARTIESLAGTLAHGEEATVRLAVDTIYPRADLQQVLTGVAAAYPTVRIDLHDSVLGGASDLLEHAEVDIAVTPILPRGGSYQTLGRIRFRPVAHPDHALHRLGRPLLLDDLRQARHIIVRDSSTRSERDSGWLQAPDYWTVGSMDISIGLITRGLGFAWLPVSRISDELADGSLLPLPMKKLNDRHAELYLAQLDDEVTGPVCAYLSAALSSSCETIEHD